MDDANWWLTHGNEYPYDGVYLSDKSLVTSPDEWSYRAARGVLANLKDRTGLRQALEDVHGDIRVEIVMKLADIIRAAR